LDFVTQHKAAATCAALLDDCARAAVGIVVHDHHLIGLQLLVYEVVEQCRQAVETTVSGNADADFHAGCHPRIIACRRTRRRERPRSGNYCPADTRLSNAAPRVLPRPSRAGRAGLLAKCDAVDRLTCRPGLPRAPGNAGYCSPVCATNRSLGPAAPVLRYRLLHTHGFCIRESRVFCTAHGFAAARREHNNNCREPLFVIAHYLPRARSGRPSRTAAAIALVLGTALTPCAHAVTTFAPFVTVGVDHNTNVFAVPSNQPAFAATGNTALGDTIAHYLAGLALD